MLRSLFQKNSIQQKLYLMHLLVIGASMSLLFVIVMVFQYISSKNDLEKDLDSQLTVINNNIDAAIAFDDKNAANETLRSLSINRNVEQAYVVTNNNKVFAKYTAQNRDSAKATMTTQSFFHLPQGKIHLSRNVIVNKQQIAVIYLDANLNTMNARLFVFSLGLFMAVFLAVMLGKLISKRLNRYITEPISYLEYFVTHITEHQNYSSRSEVQSTDEIGELSIGINKMLENIELRDKRLLEELELRKKFEHTLDQLAYYDSLTTLPNRHSFTDDIAKLLAEKKGLDGNFHLLMLDLDNFKVINDTFGHWAGDQLLRETALRLNANLDENASVYRIGGDEFAIILMGNAPLKYVEELCHRIIRIISEKFLIQNQEVFVGVSIGVVEYTGSNYDQSSLIKYADAAMYWSKNDGKNTYKIYSNDIEQAHFYKQKLIGMLENAIHNHELKLYYQPIFHSKTERIVGFESLLRWKQAEIGFISPSEFIPLAESTGLIRPIGDWVINTALDQIREWQSRYFPALFININLSGKQFEDRYLAEKIEHAISRNQLTPSTVTMEITESVMMDDVERTIQVLNTLRNLGIGIALDDFGTGHSSMNYLKQFPIDILKIDKGFVEGLPDDEVDVAIVQSLIALAKGLGLSVVAEGVETKAQLDFVVNLQCNKIQGYFYSEPLPADEVEKLLQQFYA